LVGKPTVIHGRRVYVGDPVYLGRQVRDYSPKGLSSVREVRGILRELEEDFKHGISSRTIQGRIYILFLAVLHTTLMSKSEKIRAIREINKFRKKHGWKPYKLKRPLQ